MSENEPLDVKPLEMTDALMRQFLDLIADDPEFRPYKAEVDQFFERRIWKTIEKQAKMSLATLYRQAAQQHMTLGLHAEISSAIWAMQWWLNLRDNMFAARERATGLAAQQAGGESWQVPQ